MRLSLHQLDQLTTVVNVLPDQIHAPCSVSSIELSQRPVLSQATVKEPPLLHTWCPRKNFRRRAKLILECDAYLSVSPICEA